MISDTICCLLSILVMRLVYHKDKIKLPDILFAVMLILLCPFSEISVFLTVLYILGTINKDPVVSLVRFNHDILKKVMDNITLGDGVELYRLVSPDSGDSSMGWVDFTKEKYLNLEVYQDDSKYYEFLVLNEKFETLKVVPMTPRITFTTENIPGACVIVPGRYMIWMRKFIHRYSEILQVFTDTSKDVAVEWCPVKYHQFTEINNIPCEDYLRNYALEIHQDNHRRRLLRSLYPEKCKIYPYSSNVDFWRIVINLKAGETTWIFFDTYDTKNIFISIGVDDRWYPGIINNNKHIAISTDEDKIIKFAQLIPRLPGINVPKPFAKVYSGETSHFFEELN